MVLLCLEPTNTQWHHIKFLVCCKKVIKVCSCSSQTLFYLQSGLCRKRYKIIEIFTPFCCLITLGYCNSNLIFLNFCLIWQSVIVFAKVIPEIHNTSPSQVTLFGGQLGVICKACKYFTKYNKQEINHHTVIDVNNTLPNRVDEPVGVWIWLFQSFLKYLFQIKHKIFKKKNKKTWKTISST